MNPQPVHDLIFRSDSFRAATALLARSFLSPDLGGPGVGAAGTALGNTAASVRAADAIARNSGFKRERVPAFDVDGDGVTTTYDVERWMQSPLRSDARAVDPLSMRGVGERRLRVELDGTRRIEADIVQHWLAGDYDRVYLPSAPWVSVPEPIALAATIAWLEALPIMGDITCALAGLGIDAHGRVVAVGYLWQLLMGGWTRSGLVTLGTLISRLPPLYQGSPVLRWWAAAAQAAGKSAREGNPVETRMDLNTTHIHDARAFVGRPRLASVRVSPEWMDRTAPVYAPPGPEEDILEWEALRAREWTQEARETAGGLTVPELREAALQVADQIRRVAEDPANVNQKESAFIAGQQLQDAANKAEERLTEGHPDPETARAVARLAMRAGSLRDDGATEQQQAQEMADQIARWNDSVSKDSDIRATTNPAAKLAAKLAANPADARLRDLAKRMAKELVDAASKLLPRDPNRALAEQLAATLERMADLVDAAKLELMTAEQGTLQADAEMLAALLVSGTPERRDATKVVSALRSLKVRPRDQALRDKLQAASRDLADEVKDEPASSLARGIALEIVADADEALSVAAGQSPMMTADPEMQRKSDTARRMMVTALANAKGIPKDSVTYPGVVKCILAIRRVVQHPETAEFRDLAQQAGDELIEVTGEVDPKSKTHDYGQMIGQTARAVAALE